MATSRKRGPKVVKVQTANVQLHRNGLTLDMQGVPASQVKAVAQHMLDAMRQLTKLGYGELIVDGTPLHAGPFGEVPEDAEYEESKKRMGFHSRG